MMVKIYEARKLNGSVEGLEVGRFLGSCRYFGIGDGAALGM